MDEMEDLCDVPPKARRAALLAAGGDVQKALLHLIDSGQDLVKHLNVDKVPEQLFVRSMEAFLATPAPQEPVTGSIEARYRHHTAMSRRTAYKRAVFNPVELRRMLDQRRSMQRVERRNQRLKNRPVRLKMPPFPPLTMTLSEWKGRDVFSAWAGFQARQGPYTSRPSSKPSTGAIEFEIDRLNDDDANPLPPAPEQAAAYGHLKKHQIEIRDRVVRAAFKEFKELKRRGYFDVDGSDEPLAPNIRSVAEMKKHMGLGTLHLTEFAKGGYAYLGLEFGCTWDDEHGFGVLLHKSRIIDVGQADTSFDYFPAKKDGGKPIQRGRKR